MMPYVVAAMSAGLLLAVFLRLMTRTSPALLATAARLTGGIGALFLGLVMLLRGAVLPALAFAAAGAAILAGTALQARSAAGRRSERTSSVRTSLLEMSLDHKDGQMDGRVLAGRFEGWTLSQMDVERLMLLREECLATNDQSAALLEAYLDRSRPDWREQAGATDSQPAGADHPMTEDLACEILGVPPGASPDEVRSAHRDLMKKFHPDHGGSDYLAARINEAKDFLLGGG